MLNTLVMLSFLSFPSLASVTPTDIELNPEKAFCLGFTLDRPGDEYVGLNYPKVINQKWVPVSTMVEYSFNQNPIFITRTNFDKTNKQEQMVILGFHKTMHSGGDAAVSITYQCLDKCGTDYLKKLYSTVYRQICSS
ncbi:hypothetical protein MHM95_10810 [Pseudoalteromonas sp. CnMc7-15]|uniref:hypothetical protein n=1 Tax=unclassified Pseudoalteromonas TaxID=194690 RepID=UPI001EF74915|nr:hypothetical protein [Pseudoalteromonas sp. CnMc7-15]MCG7566773.1 hypothetical protein [Pseudoalteromonas sp. CnMc7-15]